MRGGRTEPKNFWKPHFATSSLPLSLIKKPMKKEEWWLNPEYSRSGAVFMMLVCALAGAIIGWVALPAIITGTIIGYLLDNHKPPYLIKKRVTPSNKRPMSHPNDPTSRADEKLDTYLEKEVIKEFIAPQQTSGDWDGMKPALREFHHLIKERGLTEDEFVNDIVHRLTLIKKSLLASHQEEMVKKLEGLKRKETFWIGNEIIEPEDGYNSALTQAISLLSKGV